MYIHERSCVELFMGQQCCEVRQFSLHIAWTNGVCQPDHLVQGGPVRKLYSFLTVIALYNAIIGTRTHRNSYHQAQTKYGPNCLTALCTELTQIGYMVVQLAKIWLNWLSKAILQCQYLMYTINPPSEKFLGQVLWEGIFYQPSCISISIASSFSEVYSISSPKTWAL